MAKIRSGFVSNISSASYIIKFNMELEDFINEIYNAFDYQFFKVEDHIYTLEEQIKKYELALNKENLKKNNFKIYNQQQLNELKSKLEYLKSIRSLDDYNQDKEGIFIVDKIEAVKWILKHMYSVDVEEQPNWTVLKDWTSMHNSYNDVCNVLKTISIHFDFEWPKIKKLYKIEKD